MSYLIQNPKERSVCSADLKGVNNADFGIHRLMVLVATLIWILPKDVKEPLLILVQTVILSVTFFILILFFGSDLILRKCIFSKLQTILFQT